MAEKDFQYYKKWALGVLKKQYDALDKKEKENKKVSKAFSLAEKEMEKAFPVGTIRTWKGKKFIKSPDKKWRPYYEKHNSAGAKKAIANIARKINSLEDGDFEGLYNILKLHKSRFAGQENQIMEIYKLAKEKGAKVGGRFSAEKNKKKRGPLKVVSKEELHDFIQEQRNGKENIRVSLGDISEEAKKRIKEKTGIEAKRFVVDGDAIRHIYNNNYRHHLADNDLDDMKEILNTTTDIELSEKDREGNQCIRFSHKDERGLVLIEAFRRGKGDLALKTAYRTGKNRVPQHNAISDPGSTSETKHTLQENISQNDEKSSKKESECR